MLLTGKLYLYPPVSFNIALAIQFFVVGGGGFVFCLVCVCVYVCMRTCFHINFRIIFLFLQRGICNFIVITLSPYC